MNYGKPLTILAVVNYGKLLTILAVSYSDMSIYGVNNIYFCCCNLVCMYVVLYCLHHGLNICACLSFRTPSLGSTLERRRVRTEVLQCIIIIYITNKHKEDRHNKTKRKQAKCQQECKLLVFSFFLACHRLQSLYIFTIICFTRPEWCISSMIYSRDTPFWSETLDIVHFYYYLLYPTRMVSLKHDI